MLESLEEIFEDTRFLVRWLESMRETPLLPAKDQESIARMVEQEIARRIIGVLQDKGG